MKKCKCCGKPICEMGKRAGRDTCYLCVGLLDESKTKEDKKTKKEVK